MRGWIRGVTALAALACAPGCYGIQVAAQGAPHPEYTHLARPRVAPDDLQVSGLRKAGQGSLKYFASSKARNLYTIGNDTYSSAQIARSVDTFLRIVDETPPRLLNDRIARECRGYSPNQGARFTAYYEPVLEARLEKDPRFRYPIYAKPDERTLAALSASGRLTRADIDGKGVLAGRGLEIAYLDDPVALYFLHIQGSGRLRLGDGRVLRINFAGSNGLPYASIGRHMIDNGMTTAGSAGGMRSFLRSAPPDARNQILFQNPRYIFFRTVSLEEGDGPIGSLGVPLVAGRSIATDSRYVPPGSVVYIRTKVPVLDSRGTVVGWNEMARFTFNHDSGSAIKGPGRADIYWGEGDRAGMTAGFVNGPGEMVVLVCGAEPQTTASRGRKSMVNVAWPEMARALASVTNP
jgi:membrane-bound lytic murein transglycosylase A